MRYVFVVTGYNCFLHAQNCIQSIKAVKTTSEYKWMALLCSDGSNDGTTQYIHEIANEDSRFKAYSTTENYGAAFHRHHAIMDSELNDDDVIILVGLDDSVDADCLSAIHKQYSSGKWMTYGNWVDERGRTCQHDNLSIKYSDAVHETRSYRSDVYRATAMNTFKYFLYRRIPQQDLIIDGRWIHTTTESEVMFSCLEMCGKQRIGVIYEHIYYYNRYLPKRSLNRLGDKYGKNIGREEKYRILNIVKARPKRELIINPYS